MPTKQNHWPVDRNLEEKLNKTLNHTTMTSQKKIKFANPNARMQLRKTTGIEHRIITPEGSHVYAKQYPVPNKFLKATKEELNRLLKSNIIRKSKNGWASPAFRKLKPNGEVRLLINYKAVNKLTTKAAFPNPSIEDIIRKLSGSQIFSKLDLRDGYYQIEIFPEDIYKAEFVILG